MSHVTCHVSHVTCHEQHVIFFDKGFRLVCFQRGLPHLAYIDLHCILYVPMRGVGDDGGAR